MDAGMLQELSDEYGPLCMGSRRVQQVGQDVRESILVRADVVKDGKRWRRRTVGALFGVPVVHQAVAKLCEKRRRRRHRESTAVAAGSPRLTGFPHSRRRGAA